MTKLELVTFSAEQTTRIGQFLGARLPQGSVVPLCGDLGSGKTCFARGVVAGLGIDDILTFASPSFTLMNVYRARIPIVHCDFYRLSDAVEILELGFLDQIDGTQVVLIEWPERILEWLPAEYLQIHFDFCDAAGPEKRRITLYDRDQAYQDLLEELRNVDSWD